MAMDTAKKLVEELLADKARMDEFMKAPKAFLAAGGFDCTLDEMKEYYTLNREVDDAELGILTGGKRVDNCTNSWYKGSCAATVEDGSWCGSNDACHFWDVKYNCVNSSEGCSDLSLTPG